MKKRGLLALAMTLALALGMSTTTAMAAEVEESAPLSDEAFTDVPEGHWAYSALEVLSKDGVLEGYPDGSFKGDEPMTRYEMAKIIANAYKGGSFADDALIDGVRQELSGELKTLKKVENFVDRIEFGGFGQVRYENNDRKGYWLGDTADDLWLDGSTGWTFGGKYVLAKNVEAELCYGWSSTTVDGANNADYTRHVWRGQVDFHF